MREHHRSAALMLAIVIGLLGAIAIVPVQTVSAEVIGDFNYGLINNGTEVTIGTYIGTGGDIIIPDTIAGLPVTAIASQAFRDCSTLESVTLPESVSYIGPVAFAGCSSLKTINMPEGITTIEYGVFTDCSSLTSITLPSTVTTIGDYAFSRTALSSITFPDSVTTISTAAFSVCSSLTEINWGSGVTSIGDLSFASCSNLTSVTIPDGVTVMGGSVFELCEALTSVTIPGSVKNITVQAFAWCPSLKNVTIMEGVTTIEGGAFNTCEALTTMRMPSSVTNISVGAFYHCSNLTDMYFEGDAPSVEENWASNCTKLTIHYNANAMGFTSPIWNGVAAYPISGAVTVPVLTRMTPALEAVAIGTGAALIVAVGFGAPVDMSPGMGAKTAPRKKHRLLDFITGAIKADAQGLAGNVLDDLGLEKKNATEREAVIFGFSWPELFTALLASFVLGFSFMITQGIDLGSAVNWLTYILVAGVAAVSSGLTQHHTAKRLGAVVEYKLWYLGSIVLLLTTLLFGVVFSSPSKVAINDKEKMTARQQAIVSMSGPLTSFAVFLVFMALVPFGGTLASIGLLGASTNLLMAAYSMMPFIPMAGNKVFKWNKLAWAGMFVPMVVLYFAMSFLLL